MTSAIISIKGKPMKISTWNVNSLKVRLEHVCTWAQDKLPDVICLQETKTIDEQFPAEPLIERGFKVSYSGQKTYNGVAVLATREIKDVVTGIPGYEDPQRRVLTVTVDGVRVINVYVPNGQAVGSEKYSYKLEWFGHLLQFVEQQMEQYGKLAIVGDFNIAPADEDVHDPELWRGKILCSDQEREQFQNLVALGLSDAFRLFDQPERSFSWWDYRAAGFRRDLGLRIDHILVSDQLRDTCTGCIIDKEPRKWERPSDHAPVMAEFS